MPTLAQVRNRIQTFVDNNWADIVARQENYRANRGTYWQGLLTHTNMPEHLTNGYGDAIADRLAIHPTDQFQDWISVFPEWDGLAIPAALQVDVYDGPNGKGWVLTVWAKYNGQIWTRSVNVGPETERAEDWHTITLEDLKAIFKS